MVEDDQLWSDDLDDDLDDVEAGDWADALAGDLDGEGAWDEGAWDDGAWDDGAWDEGAWDDGAWDDEGPGDLAEYAELLRTALREDLQDLDTEALEDAVAEAFGSMSPAESFNFGKALRQIGRGASRVVADPAFARVAGSALPIAGGALGTVVGGPVGTALGSSLGSAVAKAIPGRTAATPAAGHAPSIPRAPVPAQVPAPPPVPPAGPSGAAAPGSGAALMALLLGQQKDALLGTLAAALGPHGRTTVNGVPVATVLRTLSSLYGQAAADADEAMYWREVASGDPTGSAPGSDVDAVDLWADGEMSDRDAYTALMDADDDELALALGTS